MANILHGKTLKVLPFREGTRQSSPHCHFNTAQSKVRIYKLRFLNKFKIFKGIHPPGKRVLEKKFTHGLRETRKNIRNPKVRNSDMSWCWATAPLGYPAEANTMPLLRDRSSIQATWDSQR